MKFRCPEDIPFRSALRVKNRFQLIRSSLFVQYPIDPVGTLFRMTFKNKIMNFAQSVATIRILFKTESILGSACQFHRAND